MVHEFFLTFLLGLHGWAISTILYAFGDEERILYFFSHLAVFLQPAMVVFMSWYCNLPVFTSYLCKHFNTPRTLFVDSVEANESVHHSVQANERVHLSAQVNERVHHSVQVNKRVHNMFSLNGLYERLKKYPQKELLSFRVIALLFWPIFNVIFMFVVYCLVDKPINEFYNCPSGLTISMVYRTITFCGFLYYGIFSSFICLVRNSFIHDMKNIAKASPYKSTEQTTSSITNIWLQLQEYRNMVGWWLCFAAAIGILKVAVVLTWTYSGEVKEITVDLELRAADIYTFWMWSNSLMLFIQPIATAGSLNVDYFWEDFNTEFMISLKAPEHQEKLKAILRHTFCTYSKGEWISPTIALSVVTIFLSFNLPQQFIWFWVRPGCTRPTPESTTIF